MRGVASKSLFVLFSSLLFLWLLQAVVQVEFFYISDSLLKIIQAESLRLSGFASESITYPAMDIDPHGEAFSHPKGYAKKFGELMLGTYPIAFSFFVGLLRSFGISFVSLVWICASFFIWAIFIWSRELRFTIGEFRWLFFFSLLLCLGLDCSEYGIFFFLQTLGFLAFLRFWKLQSLFYLFWFGFFTSLSTWFRLESVFLGLACAGSYLAYPRKPHQSLISIAKQTGVLLLATLPLLFFFLRNQRVYGSSLGPRVLFSYIGSEYSLFEIGKRMLSTTLFYFSGSPKIGFFLSSAPLLLLLFVSLSLWKQRKASKYTKLLLSIAMLNLLLVNLTSPNDGITIHGRYHILSLLPIVSLISSSRVRNEYLTYRKTRFSLIAIGVVLNLFAFLVFVQASKQVRLTQEFYRKHPSDLILFDHDFFCQEAGLLHLKSRILCIHEATNIERLLNGILESESVNSISYFSMNPKNRNLGMDQMTLEEKRNITKRLSEKFLSESPSVEWKDLQVQRWNRF